MFVALAVAGVVISRWPEEVDFEAICEQRCACEQCDPRECIEQGQQILDDSEGCREAYVALAKCKLEPGNAKCERGGGFVVWMPVGCDRELDAYVGCLERARQRDEARAEPNAVSLIPKGGTLQDDLRMVCDAPNHLSEEAKADPSQRATELARYIEARIGTDEARELFDDLAPLGVEDKKARFREAARSVGIEDCAFLETLP